MNTRMPLSVIEEFLESCSEQLSEDHERSEEDEDEEHEMGTSRNDLMGIQAHSGALHIVIVFYLYKNTAKVGA